LFYGTIAGWDIINKVRAVIATAVCEDGYPSVFTTH